MNLLAGAPPLLSVREVAERLGHTRATIYRLIEDEGLPAVRAGVIKVPSDELQVWLEGRRLGGHA